MDKGKQNKVMYTKVRTIERSETMSAGYLDRENGADYNSLEASNIEETSSTVPLGRGTWMMDPGISGAGM